MTQINYGIVSKVAKWCQIWRKKVFSVRETFLWSPQARFLRDPFRPPPKIWVNNEKFKYRHIIYQNLQNLMTIHLNIGTICFKTSIKKLQTKIYLSYFQKLAKFRPNFYVSCKFCSKFKEIITGKPGKIAIEMIFSHIWAGNVFILIFLCIFSKKYYHVHN